MFRLSGPQAFAIAQALIGRLPAPGRAALRPLRAADGDLIDEGLVLLFKSPASFTGEDVAEFHLHGSPAVADALTEAVLGLGGRLAEAGEFTRRALMNGKLDLAEVEGLADLLDAETASQRKQALGQFGGRLSALAEGWRARLLAILTPLEAAIDFPDEADVPADIAARARPEIDALLAELSSYLEGAGRARAIREGVKIALIGAPNAGKSSLMNRLAGSERAIVHDSPGTTRDVIEARLDLGGIAASLFDTAGLRAAAGDPVEAEGVRRTRINASEADIRVLIIDISAPEGADGDGPAPQKMFHVKQFPADLQLVVERSPAYGLLREGDLVVFNKADLLAAWPQPHLAEGRAAFAVSAKSGEGVGGLIEALSAAAARLCGRAEEAALTRPRHTAAVRAAIGHLEAARGRPGAAELAAEDVRLAARSLGSITGAVGVEDVLAEIFKGFCIGK